MALTTECPFCRTAFLVANDQLKIRAGLVRCGACKEVFNAEQHLLTEEHDAVPAPAPAYPSPAEKQPSLARAPATEASPVPAAPATAPAPEIRVEPGFGPAPEADAQTTASRQMPPEKLEAEQLSGMAPINVAVEFVEFVETNRTDKARSEPTLAEAHATAPVDVPIEAFSATRAPLPPTAAATPPEARKAPDARMDAYTYANVQAQEKADRDFPPEAEEPEADEPDFVKRTRRAQGLRKVIRLCMATGSLLLFIGLLLQGAYTFRDLLAASVPELKPALVRGCALLECRIGLPAQIEAISIESSELQQSAKIKDALVLTLLLRNRSSYPQSWPMLELSLKDANEKVIIRRSFIASDYLPARSQPANGFAAASEQQIKLVLAVDQLKPAGYALHVFYP